MSKTKTGSNYQWGGPSLSLNYIGNRVYAYSGSVTVNATDKDLLSFNTGADGLLIQIEWGTDGVDAQTTRFQMTLNNNVVLYKRVGTAGSDNRDDLAVGTNQVNMILPPYSDVVFNIENTGATNQECTVWLIGEVING